MIVNRAGLVQDEVDDAHKFVAICTSRYWVEFPWFRQPNLGKFLSRLFNLFGPDLASDSRLTSIEFLAIV